VGVNTPRKDTGTARIGGDSAARSPFRVVLVMGVSGSGKTVVGRLLATAIGWTFRDADDLHPPENVARMRSGQPLTDADREPWLQSLAAVVDAALASSGPGLVLACSALKRSYRDRLRVADPRVKLVHLTGPETILRERISARVGHYMPASLLTSQLATLEPPEAAERALVIDVIDPPESIAARILEEIAPPPRN
jgi:gluconokinase